MAIKLVRRELPSWFGKGANSWRDAIIVKQLAGFQALERGPNGKMYVEILVQAWKRPIEIGIAKRHRELDKLLKVAKQLRTSTS